MRRPGVKQINEFQVMQNVYGYLNIPTGSLVPGLKGETIINGGVPLMSGFMGPGNSFKTAIMEGFEMTAADHVMASIPDTIIMTLDTEQNKQIGRMQSLASLYPNLYRDDLFDPETGNWIVSDIIDISGERWFEEIKEYFKERDKHSRKRHRVPFNTPKGREISTRIPNFIEIDSLSAFEVSSSGSMLSKNELGSSDANMYFMRNGLVKTVFLKELLGLSRRYEAYSFFTTHFGKDSSIQSGPPGMQPAKKVQHMPAGTKAKGISDNAYYLASHLWLVKKSVALASKANRNLPEYPYSPDDSNPDPNELNMVTMGMVRSKTGRSGFMLNIVVSQDYGIDHDMTNFMIVKENGFGIHMGGKGLMKLDLYPEVSFSRKTIRQQLREDTKLRRCMEITADLFMLSWFHPTLNRNGLMKTPTELYNIIKKSYSWDTLLASRSWWTYDQYKYKIPFLSTVDLLKMAAEQYKPYWL